MSKAKRLTVRHMSTKALEWKRARLLSELNIVSVELLRRLPSNTKLPDTNINVTTTITST
jgi:hypothetical protein